MTNETSTTDTAPASPVPAAAPSTASARRPTGPAPRRGGGGLAIAILFSLAALGAAGYTGWTVWNMRQDLGAANGLRGQVDTLQTAVDGLRDDNANLRRRISDADGVNRSAREEMLGVSERTRNLEDAVANLSERSLSGHDAMLLDEAESLLRMAKERFALFGDAKYWWSRAKTMYTRARKPVENAVMVFKVTTRLKLDHVAVVTHVVSKREIRVEQANWQNHGEIDHSTPIMDVSKKNDWSQVRVWDLRSKTFGRVYAVSGFILRNPTALIARE